VGDGELEGGGGLVGLVGWMKVGDGELEGGGGLVGLVGWWADG